MEKNKGYGPEFAHLASNFTDQEDDIRSTPNFKDKLLLV